MVVQAAQPEGRQACSAARSAAGGRGGAAGGAPCGSRVTCTMAVAAGWGAVLTSPAAAGLQGSRGAGRFLRGAAGCTLLMLLLLLALTITSSMTACSTDAQHRPATCQWPDLVEAHLQLPLSGLSRCPSPHSAVLQVLSLCTPASFDIQAGQGRAGQAHVLHAMRPRVQDLRRLLSRAWRSSSASPPPAAAPMGAACCALVACARAR